NFFNATPPNRNGSESKVIAADACIQKQKNNNKEEEEAGASSMDSIQLPRPIFNFQASSVAHHWEIGCFPLRGREVLCIDQNGCCFLFDGDTRNAVTMPGLCQPKRFPLSLFVPSTGVDNDSGSLFIMESVVKPKSTSSGPRSDQFEAFVYRTPSPRRHLSSTCQSLPPPPFVRDPKFSNIRTKITSYAVVSGGSEMCISVEGAGTYCMDTVKHTWRHVGEWILPFNGKVKYVPELKLWFGLSAKTNHLAATDLSAMDDDCFQQPELLKTWMELSPPKNWWDLSNSHLVSLGSGRFCIARFFYTRHLMGYYYDQIVDNRFVVLTGVDVVPCVHDTSSGIANGGTGDLRMIKYESKLHVPNGSGEIERVF
ncbi:Os04g0677000, partial [Oryza sativa Japonica Group]